MGGVFDRLQQRLSVQKREEGITALELAELPPNLRKLMRLMLREAELEYPAICAAIEAMPESGRLKKDELDQALAELTKQNWLQRTVRSGIATYQVNLRRKAGVTLPPGIWTALDERIAQSKQTPTEPETKES